MKAAGLNAVSIYVHWGLVNPAPGVFDWDGYRSLETFYDAASEVGLWVILRPGPYINAETTAGGIPHWVTSTVAGHLRTNDTAYREAWTPYIREIARVSRGYQVSEGGPIIAVQVDNEYSDRPKVGWPGKVEMMQEVEDELRAGGIVVPLTYNDARPQGAFVKGVGAVDLYGLDGYPQAFDCSNPDIWRPLVETYYDFHMKTNPEQPWYTPEFQGGAFDAWGPTAPGYDACRQLTNEQFVSVFYKNLYAHNFKLINIYMFYGGTTWGHLPFPGVYTSYDYGAPIAESRQIESPKYAEIKRQAMFIRSTPDIRQTKVVGNSSTDAVEVLGAHASEVFVTQLQNPVSQANFYIARAKNSTSTRPTSFRLTVDSSVGKLHIPVHNQEIHLAGRESLILVSNLRFGALSHLLYSTAEVMWSGMLGDRDALVLYGRPENWHEALIEVKAGSSFTSTQGVSFSHDVKGYSLVMIQPGVEGIITLFESATQIVLYMDTSSTENLWFPAVESASSAHWHAYWQFGTNETVLVHGPHLIRKAVVEGHGDDTLSLYGDLKDNVRLIIMGWPKSVRKLLWNGQPIEADFSEDHTRQAQQVLIPSSTRLVLELPLKASDSLYGGIKVPTLENWMYADSLPEVKGGFNDQDWVTADHSSTNIPYKPYGNGPVLYGCDYGFCEGVTIWRGHFVPTSQETILSLVINGGAAFAASIWVNDHFLGTTYGNSTNNQNIIRETNSTWIFPSRLVEQTENVVTIVQDNMGLEETGDDEDADFSKSPRGIRLAHMVGGEFTHWKVQGKQGGYSSFPDKTRGIFNEGGSFAERQSWHLPSVDTSPSSWIQRDLSSGLPDGRAGLGFFTTTFDLNIPLGLDVPMSFEFDQSNAPYRALLFVNGWMMGKRVANIGPQWKFPVHEGILKYNGRNSVGLLVWSMEAVPISPKLMLKVDGVYDIPF
ncbi:glycoside hydrolase family 35 protein [Clavulina sp. PMI_390]|nr:glycoside hydrolase family 35 protein [Clavulina sp. PMI_390]